MTLDLEFSGSSLRLEAEGERPLDEREELDLEGDLGVIAGTGLFSGAAGTAHFVGTIDREAETADSEPLTGSLVCD